LFSDGSATCWRLSASCCSLVRTKGPTSLLPLGKGGCCPRLLACLRWETWIPPVRSGACQHLYCEISTLGGKCGSNPWISACDGSPFVISMHKHSISSGPASTPLSLFSSLHPTCAEGVPRRVFQLLSLSLTHTSIQLCSRTNKFRYLMLVDDSRARRAQMLL